MKSPKHYFALAIMLFVFIGIWLSSVFFVPAIAKHFFPGAEFYPSSSGQPGLLSSYGAIGDLFGAINSLFSGLALGAIALTLWIESRSRREARKPLVISGLDSSDGFVIGRPRGQGLATLLPVKMTFDVENQSSDAALNVSIQVALVGISVRPLHVSLDGPLIRNVEQKLELEADLSREGWSLLLDRLTGGISVELRVLTKYRSLEGVDWVTEVTHELKLRKDTQDLLLLNAARSDTWTDEATWDPQAQVAIHSKIKAGSWDHRLASKA